MGYKEDGKNEMLDALGALITHASLHTGFPCTAINEITTGGESPYTREAITWSPADEGEMEASNQPEFDVPGSTTVAGVGFWTASSEGTILADADVDDEVFTNAGTYTLTSVTLDLNNDPA